MRHSTWDTASAEFHGRFATARDMFCLNTLQRYGEREIYRRLWAEGDRAACGRAMGPWLRQVVHPAAAAGRAMRRVHVIQFPLTPNIAFEMECYRHSVAGGEDVRIIPVPWGSWPEKIPAGVPRQDFWRFDDVVADMEYDEHGALVAIYLTDDEQRLAEARAAQAAAWGAATLWQNLWPGNALHESR